MAACARDRVRRMRESDSPLHPRCSRGERRQRSAFRLDRKHLAASPFAPASRGRFAVLLRPLSSGVLPPIVGSEVPGVHVVLAGSVCAGDELPPAGRDLQQDVAEVPCGGPVAAVLLEGADDSPFLRVFFPRGLDRLQTLHPCHLVVDLAAVVAAIDRRRFLPADLELGCVDNRFGGRLTVADFFAEDGGDVRLTFGAALGTTLPRVLGAVLRGGLRLGLWGGGLWGGGRLGGGLDGLRGGLRGVGGTALQDALLRVERGFGLGEESRLAREGDVAAGGPSGVAESIHESLEAGEPEVDVLLIYLSGFLEIAVGDRGVVRCNDGLADLCHYLWPFLLASSSFDRRIAASNASMTSLKVRPGVSFHGAMAQAGPQLKFREPAVLAMYPTAALMSSCKTLPTTSRTAPYVQCRPLSSTSLPCTQPFSMRRALASCRASVVVIR